MASGNIELPNESGQTDLYTRPSTAVIGSPVRALTGNGGAVERTNRSTTTRGPARRTAPARAPRGRR